jgi:hypothetical protein
VARFEVHRLRRLHTLMRSTVARLRRLTPPRGDEAQIARYLAGIELNARRVKHLAETTADRRHRRAQSLREALAAGTVATRQVAVQYGFKVCGTA